MEKYRKYVVTSSVKKIEPITLVEGKGATLKDSNGFGKTFFGNSGAEAIECGLSLAKK
jgi:acetylornithine/succinyldiaminopimelate/putrescine aminotransferase